MRLHDRFYILVGSFYTGNYARGDLIGRQDHDGDWPDDRAGHKVWPPAGSGLRARARRVFLTAGHQPSESLNLHESRSDMVQEYIFSGETPLLAAGGRMS